MPESRAARAVPSPEELVERATALVPVLRANAAEAEQLQHLTDASVAALEAAGLFRMFRPIARGGYAADAATIAKVTTLIASGCASTAWVMSIYSSVAQLAELLGEKALAEIYAGPHTRIAGVFGKSGASVEPVEGGYRVRGEGLWPFNSGCHHAAWDLLLLTVEEPGAAPWQAFAAVPMTELTLCDDWDVMGARGTGSCSVSCGDMFIPAHRVAPVPQNLFGLFDPDISAGQSCSLALGMARYAYELFVDLAKSGGINHLGYARMGDAPIVQTAVARAAADIKLIEAFQQLRLAVRASGADRDPAESGVLAIGPVRCFELARGVIESLFALAPSSEIHRARPLQRLLRDIHTFQHQHAATPHIAYEQFGRGLLAEPGKG